MHGFFIKRGVNMQRTPFYECHLSFGGKMVDFGGWELPVNYGSQIKEHECVRNSAGMFDVSHMVITDIYGSGAKDFLRYLLSNDVNKLEKHGFGKALYSGMLNENAGVIDDLIVYLMPFGYRIVTNAATYEKDKAWISCQLKSFAVEIKERNDFAMLAVQGPQAIDKIAQIKPLLADKLLQLKQFTAIEDNQWFFARTGYTGENGLEIMLPVAEAKTFWQELINIGVMPCGLGARDTLRLEAGMNLYGHDMNEQITPLECGMDWVVDLADTTRNFIGRNKYEKFKNQLYDMQIGLILDGKGVLREGQKLMLNGINIGIITSGTFSPSLKQSVAIARISPNVNSNILVDIRGNLEPITIVKLPFIRNGKAVYAKIEPINT